MMTIVLLVCVYLLFVVAVVVNLLVVVYVVGAVCVVNIGGIDNATFFGVALVVFML